MERKIESYEDLEVYQRLCELHLEVNELTFGFPKFELFELGSQLRRSSNSAPANIAEGWNNKHTNIYLEGIDRAQGEIRETKHHIKMVFKKRYIEEPRYKDLTSRYDQYGRVLKALENSLISWESNTENRYLSPKTKNQ
jgi:four helix bundle protein